MTSPAEPPGRRTFVQLGAGAGDQDPSTRYRDGFTNVVKKWAGPADRIILIEPNPRNLEPLSRCWRDWPTSEIHAVAVVPTRMGRDSVDLFLASSDGPHFQRASVFEGHVRQHCPGADLRTIRVPCTTLPEFLRSVCAEDVIELLAVDIEGLDAEVILDVDWSTLPCRSVSFEFVHRGRHGVKVDAALKAAGFVPSGFGVDDRLLDVLYRRPTGTWDRWACRGGQVPFRLFWLARSPHLRGVRRVIPLCVRRVVKEQVIDRVRRARSVRPAAVTPFDPSTPVGDDTCG